jgi:hypothetical protein
MNFVYLSPHFPFNYQEFCVQLRHLGVNVLGLGDAQYDALGLQLQHALGEYYRVDDLHNYDQLLRACGHFTHRHGKIDRLDSHAEYWLETEARLRSDFNIPGIKTDVIQSIKRKSQMKEVFRRAGVPVARGRVCRSLGEAQELADEVGFPVIAKPDIGVGALSTYRLNTPQALQTFLDNPPSVDYIFEEYISGDLYSFDGLTDREGNLRFHTSHHFCRGIMDIVSNDDHIYYYSLRQIPPDLEEMGLKVLSAFNVRERFFHFEFFRRHDDGTLVALEVNMRPPGGLTTDMFNFANDFNIYREWANVVVNNRFEADWSRNFHALYVGRKVRFPYAHSHEDILGRFNGMLCHHEAISSVFSSALGSYGYIIRSPHLEEVLEAAHFVLETS